MKEHWDKNKSVYRLDLDKNREQVTQIEYPLDRVITQPRGASVGNHALLIMAMQGVFGAKLNKRDAVEGALWCLGMEHEIMNIEGSDTYIAELKQEYAERQRWADEADSQ